MIATAKLGFLGRDVSVVRRGPHPPPPDNDPWYSYRIYAKNSVSGYAYVCRGDLLRGSPTLTAVYPALAQ